jgi:uracil-DNA glycosylase family 4
VDVDEEDSKWSRLLDLYGEIDEDPRWDYLREPGIRLVPGDGPETAEAARIMVVGEAPGAVENGTGKPFVGPSGEALNELLGLAHLTRSQVFVTNVIKYRPAGNRTPSFGESVMARDVLRREWKIINPGLTIAVGAVAHKVLHPGGVDGTLALSRMVQGSLVSPKPGKYFTSIYHPAFGLRYPAVRDRIEAAWDLLGAEIQRVRRGE